MSAPAPALEGFSLSPQQARLWALHGDEGATPYRSSCAVMIEGPLDADRLARALADLVARFEVLRTSFRVLPEMAVPLQVVHDRGDVRLERLAPVADGDEAWRGAVSELLTRAGREADTPDPSSPATVSLLPVGERRHVLVITLPALCCDRLGLRNLVGALWRAYRDPGGSPANDELQLADLAQWQNEILASADQGMGADHFRRMGAEAAACGLPLPRWSQGEPFAPAEVEVPIPPTLGERLVALAGAEEVPLEALLVAAWQVLLARLTGGAAPPVGICFDGRNFDELEQAVGPFEKYLPASGAPLSGAEPLTAVARRLAAGLDDLRRWQECFTWEGSLGLAGGGAPFFFPATFELVDRSRFGERLDDGAAAEVSFSLLAEHCLSERFEARLVAMYDGTGIALRLAYDAGLFDAVDVAGLGERLAALLDSFTSRPELAIERLGVVPEVERRRLLEEWSGAAVLVADGPQSCSHERFEEQARRHPDRVALVCEDAQLTYADLDALANRIARRLRRSGVGPEVAVGLCADRSAVLIAGILGIWKAGGAYVPLDPALPAERLGVLLEDGGVRVALDAGQLARKLDLAGIEAIPLDAEAEEIARESGAPLPGGSRPEHLAYVLFTSGSTGRPKGVAVEHRHLDAYLRGVLPRLGLREGASFACVSTFAADLGHTAIFPALTTGGCLHLLTEDRCTDPNAFREYAAGHAIDCLKIVPGHLQALLSGARPEQALPRRLLVLGGDVSHWDLVDRVRGLAPGCAVLNHYGPTEATVGALSYPLPEEDRPASATVPVGRPFATSTVYLLDGFGEPVPAGAPGEVYLGGGGVARGYRGEPGLTAAAFVPHPWGSAGERLYRTGDRARFLPDGSLEFLGRVDRQAKIRGFRIELDEVAAALERHGAVRACAVTAPAGDGGERRLVAYAATGGEAVEASNLRAHLERLLPAAMIPSAFVVLDRLPRTANGKVDLAALPPPPQAGFDGEETAPRTPTEERLAAIWKPLLGVERLGVEQSFFDLGGHSLLAMRLVSQVGNAFGADVPLRDFVENPTLAGMAAAIDRAEGGESGPRLPVLVPDPEHRHEPFPLTDVQQAYWIGRSGSFELGNVATHAYLELDFPALDVARLEAGLRRVIDRHEMLRTVILPTGEQQILPEVPPYEIELADLCGSAPQEAAATLEQIRDEMSHQVLPTDRWPLFEVRVSRLAEDHFRLHVSSDALVRDAWSFRIISEDLLAVYVDPEHRLEPLEVSFRDYVLAEEAFADSEVYRRSLAHWRERLATLPPAPQLPLARNPAGLAQPRFTSRRGTLDRAAWERLQQRGAGVGLSPTGLLLAVFSEVLAAWSKSPRFTVNLTLFNRFPIHPQVDRVVGDFTSLLLVGIDASGSDDFERRARRIQERLWEDLDHRHVSGVRVLREMMRNEGSAGRAAMPVVFTSVLGFPAVEEAESPLQAEQVYAVNQTPQVWLDHLVFEERGALVYQWAVVEELFPPGLVDDMFAAFARLLDTLADGEESWSEPVPELVPGEQLARRAALNATAAPVSSERLETLFLERAARQPDEPAVVAPDRTLTYGELECWSRHLAGRLRGLGGRPGRLVAVVMEKGWEQAAAALGVLRAGAAYLPVDAGLPPERLRLLLSLGQVEIALVQPEVEERLEWPEGIALVPVAGPVPEVGSAGTEELGPEPAGTPEDLAYVIFTSGSTGQPKGVMIDHRGAVNTLLDVNRRFGVGAGDRLLALSALNFDLSVYDLFGLLAAGGAIVLPSPSARRDPEAWTRLAAGAGVTLWNTVPALMEMWVEYLEAHRDERPEGLRLALLSGDWIPVGLPDRIRALFPEASVISLGGATEASIWSILYPIDAVDPAWKSIPYGRPMVNQSFHVLDEAGRPRPEWVPGELWIGGVGLALGYWRDEEKTSAAFARLPAGGGGAERLYRTGDHGRYLPSGDIEFLGREDLQVKVQGHRIELGEIEAALVQHPAVQACAVTAPAAPGGLPRRLAAYVVAGDRPAPAAEELAEFLGGKLPAALVPGVWVFLDALPLSANGKVDRAALPLPEAPPPAEPEEGAEASGIALRIAEVVAEALKVDRVDPNASLLELGASSIDMVRIANRLEDEFGFRPRMNDLFRFSIVGAVSEHYQALLSRGEVYAGLGEAAPSESGPPWDAAGGLLRDPEERDRFKQRQHGRRLDLAERERVPLDPGPSPEAAWAAFLGRRSHRRFAADALPAESLGALLACLRQVSLDAAPKYRYGSAGGLYPVQAYLYVKPDRVDGLAAGTYYHDPLEHSLVLLDPEARIEGSVYGWISQPVFEAAAFAVYLVAQAGAIVPMYGERSRDFSLIEAGLIAQLLESEAAAHGVGLCQIGGVQFDRVRPLFDLDDGHALLHSLVGGPVDRELDAELRRTAELGGWEEGRL